MAQSSKHLHERVHTGEMEFVDIPGTQLRVSRVALGTWAMGGSMWGGTDERESVKTIWAALDQGINLIDTAPAYGSGVSEELVARRQFEPALFAPPLGFKDMAGGSAARSRVRCGQTTSGKDGCELKPARMS